jgi:hypothetical protein
LSRRKGVVLVLGMGGVENEGGVEWTDERCEVEVGVSDDAADDDDSDE